MLRLSRHGRFYLAPMKMGPLVNVLFPLLGLYWVAIVVVLFRWRKRLRAGRLPITQAVPRPPGHSLELESRDCYVKLVFWALVVAFAPAYTVLSHARLRGGAAMWVFVVVGAALTVSGLYNAYRQIKAIHRLRVERDGKLVAGQGLEAAVTSEHRVYHDVPTDDAYLDHIIVGPNGVFAIQTRAYYGQPDATRHGGEAVTLDGRRLCFAHDPARPETRSVVDAEQKAEWLKTWIAARAREHVAVHPVLVLPGWRVERQSQRDTDVEVLSDSELHRLAEGGRVLQPTLVHRIAREIDQRNRAFTFGASAPQGESPRDIPVPQEK